jgi:AcrR family transcriptional regulator
MDRPYTATLDSPPSSPERRLLQAAAVELVAEGGVESLSDEALARRAGIDESQLRGHVHSAEACLLDAYDDAVDRLTAECVVAFGSARTWRVGVVSATRLMLGRLAAHPQEARLLFYEILRGGREMCRRRDDARRRAHAMLAEEQRRSRPDEEFPAVQFELMQGALFQAIAVEVEAGRTTDLRRLEPRIVDMAATFDPVLI